MGNDGFMIFRFVFSSRTLLGAAGILTAAIVWEMFTRSGIFPRSLTPSLVEIGWSIWRMTSDGILLINAIYTVARLIVGLLLACAVGIPLGMAMGRYMSAQTAFHPLISVLMPIPSLALVPIFILWFGLGNVTTTLVVANAAIFPMIYNVWSGVRASNPIWLRAASAMGCPTADMFWKISLPAALPFIIAGLRLSYGRAWMAVIGGELLAGTDYGLGRLIFESKEWLATADMMAAIVMIGVLALISERLIFQALDKHTVIKWGMVRFGDRA